MKRILVVDDTPALLSLVATVIQLAQHQPLPAACAEDALDLLEQSPDLDALITDIRMPGMNGFELASAIRKIRHDLPILFISGYFDSEANDHMEWLRKPKVGFLRKPFQSVSLLQELDALLTP